MKTNAVKMVALHTTVAWGKAAACSAGTEWSEYEDNNQLHSFVCRQAFVPVLGYVHNVHGLSE